MKMFKIVNSLVLLFALVGIATNVEAAPEFKQSDNKFHYNRDRSRMISIEQPTGIGKRSYVIKTWDVQSRKVLREDNFYTESDITSYAMREDGERIAIATFGENDQYKRLEILKFYKFYHAEGSAFYIDTYKTYPMFSKPEAIGFTADGERVQVRFANKVSSFKVSSELIKDAPLPVKEEESIFDKNRDDQDRNFFPSLFKNPYLPNMLKFVGISALVAGVGYLIWDYWKKKSEKEKEKEKKEQGKGAGQGAQA